MADSRRTRHGGFTLVEALVATAVGLVTLSAFGTFYIAQMYLMRGQAGQVDLQTAARSVIDLFASEVRRAGSGTNPNCTGTASTGVLLGSASQLRIRADLDADGLLTGSNEDVTYTISGNHFLRTDNNAGRIDTLWSGASLSGSQLSYYDRSGNQLIPGTSGLTAAQLLQVKRVQLQLSLAGKSTNPHSTMQQNAKEVAVVELRNRYFVSDANCGYN